MLEKENKRKNKNEKNNGNSIERDIKSKINYSVYTDSPALMNEKIVDEKEVEKEVVLSGRNNNSGEYLLPPTSSVSNSLPSSTSFLQPSSTSFISTDLTQSTAPQSQLQSLTDTLSGTVSGPGLVSEEEAVSVSESESEVSLLSSLFPAVSVPSENTDVSTDARTDVSTDAQYVPLSVPVVVSTITDSDSDSSIQSESESVSVSGPPLVRDGEGKNEDDTEKAILSGNQENEKEEIVDEEEEEEDEDEEDFSSPLASFSSSLSPTSTPSTAPRCLLGQWELSEQRYLDIDR